MCERVFYSRSIRWIRCSSRELSTDRVSEMWGTSIVKYKRCTLTFYLESCVCADPGGKCIPTEIRHIVNFLCKTRGCHGVSSKHTTIASPIFFFAPFNFQDQISFGVYWCVFQLVFVTDVEQEPEALAGLAFNKHLNVTFPQQWLACCTYCKYHFCTLQYVNLPFLHDSFLRYALDIYLFIIKYRILCWFLLLI